jgi:hypothetical protein
MARMNHHIDVCNGDADGLCATVQWRLHRQQTLCEPAQALLVTGLKRDIALLARVQALGPQPGDEVNVFDIAMLRNQAALRALLDAGVRVRYVDHHETGEVPAHPLLSAHIDQAAHTCTSLIVDGLLGGAHRAWALAGAYGDNLIEEADRLAASSGFTPAQAAVLRQLGEAINYNAYGDTDADVCIPPAQLLALLTQHADPFAFMAQAPVAAEMLAHRAADLQRAHGVAPLACDARSAVYVLPDEAWGRRVSGTFANELAQAHPRRAHAVLTVRGDGGYVVSVRAPMAQPFGACALCGQFGGSGRTGAAGVDGLAASQLPGFIEALRRHAWSG